MSAATLNAAHWLAGWAAFQRQSTPISREHAIREFELFCQQPTLPCEELVTGERISLGSATINLDTGEIVEEKPQPQPE